MPDKKISEMTAASSVNATDELPIVQSGANFKATVDQLRAAVAAGDNLVVCADGSIVGMKDASATNYFTIDTSSGNCLLQVSGDVAFNAAGYMQLNPAGELRLKYTAVNAGDWSGTAPQWVHDALDRIAAAVAGLLGSSIP